MSQQNVDTIHSTWEAWTTGDATALAVLDSDVVYEDDLLPDHVGETYRGVDGLLKASSIWAEPWDEFETDIEWMRAAASNSADIGAAVTRYPRGGILGGRCRRRTSRLFGRWWTRSTATTSRR